VNKAVFLDRDGTINVDFGYVFNPDKLKFINGVVDSLKMLIEAGYMLIIITNQSGIGRGLFTEKDAMNFNKYLCEKLSYLGIEITDVFMCVHSPEDNCVCRKPSPYLINEAIKKYNIDITTSFMLGDKPSDVQCGISAGVKSYLISSQTDFSYWTNYILKYHE